MGKSIIFFLSFMHLGFCEMTVTKIWILDYAEWRKILGTFLACFNCGFPEMMVFCRCGVSELMDVLLQVVFRSGRRDGVGRRRAQGRCT